MTKHLCFVTDGLIDLRAFTTFGFNAKPNTTNPIGVLRHWSQTSDRCHRSPRLQNDRHG
jgi:hypothetical protein